MVSRIWTFAALLMSFSSVQSQGVFSEFETTCSSLGAALSIDNTTVNFAQYVAAGTNLTFDQSGDLASCGRPSQVTTADMCRIAMRVATSNQSEITLEAWLPTNWTGRFLSTGNGGTSGCIQYEDMAYTTGMGFATVGANNGHNGTSGLPWLNNPDSVDDFGYRSMHTGVVVGKQVTKTLYASDYTKSYYLGCSTGGRQGFKAVQEFPEDFDGLVVGAPAVAFNNLTSWSEHFFSILGTNTSDTYLPTNLWIAVHQMILDQCDGIDGVVDGIIEDPSLCIPRPEALMCSPGNTTNCLTNTQAASVRAVFADYYGEDGVMIYPRMQPGSELIAQFILYNGQPFQYSIDWYRYAVYNDPNWDPAIFTIKDAANAARLDPGNIQTWNGNLSAFQSRGGKVLHYHGQADPIITSDNSPRYYNHVSETMSLPSSSLDEFYRFFRISGMGHCSGGDGAWQVGQVAAGGSKTPQTNVLMRMVAWVEENDAPETITGHKFVNDTVELGVELTRDHCKYPLRNFCVDPANPQLAASWKCI